MALINNLYSSFLGHSPEWYKKTIIGFLIVNPFLLWLLNQLNFDGGFIMGWVLLIQFIFTLALALKCYPLQPGGLIAIQSLFMGLTTPYTLMHEVENNRSNSVACIYGCRYLFHEKLNANNLYKIILAS